MNPNIAFTFIQNSVRRQYSTVNSISVISLQVGAKKKKKMRAEEEDEKVRLQCYINIDENGFKRLK